MFQYRALPSNLEPWSNNLVIKVKIKIKWCFFKDVSRECFNGFNLLFRKCTSLPKLLIAQQCFVENITLFSKTSPIAVLYTEPPGGDCNVFRLHLYTHKHTHIHTLTPYRFSPHSPCWWKGFPVSRCSHALWCRSTITPVPESALIQMAWCWKSGADFLALHSDFRHTFPPGHCFIAGPVFHFPQFGLL